MVRLVRFLLALTWTSPALASVTLTVAAPVNPPPTGAYIQVDLINCSSGSYINSSTLVPQSQRFYLNTQPSVTFTIADNVTGIVCPISTQAQSAPNLLSYYTVSYFFAGAQTILKSVELPPGTFNLANLANVTSPPYQPGASVGPVGPASIGAYNIDQYCQGGCTGAQKIAAAEAALNGFPAQLLATDADTLSSIVTLGANHTLRLKNNWSFSSGGGITLNGNKAGVECDPNVNLTTTLVNANLITATGIDSPSVVNCEITGPTTSNFNLTSFNNVTRPKVVGNIVHYGTPITGDTMTDVDWEHNVTNNSSALAYVSHIDRGIISHNRAQTVSNNGIVVFNNEANPAKYCGTNPIGTGGCTVAGTFSFALVTTGHLTIDDNYVNGTTQACIFLSGVLGSRVTNSDCHNATDIGLDDEAGVSNVWLGGQSVDNCGNYAFGAEFETLNVTFSNITASTCSGHILISGNNNNSSIGHQNLTFSNITGFCQGTDTICSAYATYSYGYGVTLQNSTFTNSIITAAQQPVTATHIFKNVTLKFSFSSTFGGNSANAFTAVDPCGGVIPGNPVTSSGGCTANSKTFFEDFHLFGTNVPAGSTGLYLNHYDFNATSLYYADNNSVFGFTNGLSHSGHSGNVGGTFLNHNLLTDGVITTGGTNAYYEGFHNCYNISTCGNY